MALPEGRMAWNIVYRAAEPNNSPPINVGVPLWWLGSRKTMLVCSVGLAASWLVLAASTNIVVLFVARVSCGAWLGLTTIGVSLYVAEVAPVEKRALYTGLAEAATSAGIFACYVLSALSWRIQAAVWSVVPLGLLGAQRFLVESPRWLLFWGRVHDADTAATRLYGYDLPPELKRRKSQDDSVKAPVSHLCACLVLHVVQGCTCAHLFLYQGTQIMEALVADLAAPAAAAIVTFLHAAFVALFASFTSVTGRRRLLGVSALLVALCFCVFQPFEHLVFRQWSAGSRVAVTSWRAVYSVNLLVLSYSVGLCHIPGLLTAELCSGPGLLNHAGASVAWSLRWLLAFLLLRYDRMLMEFAQRENVPLVVAVTMALLTGDLVVFLPETEHRTLAAIEHGR
ncbi:facilitated trehalose transporter Tret1-like [Amblyomma americanum]